MSKPTPNTPGRSSWSSAFAADPPTKARGSMPAQLFAIRPSSGRPAANIALQEGGDERFNHEPLCTAVYHKVGVRQQPHGKRSNQFAL